MVLVEWLDAAGRAVPSARDRARAANFSFFFVDWRTHPPLPNPPANASPNFSKNTASSMAVTSKSPTGCGMKGSTAPPRPWWPRWTRRAGATSCSGRGATPSSSSGRPTAPTRGMRRPRPRWSWRLVSRLVVAPRPWFSWLGLPSRVPRSQTASSSLPTLPPGPPPPAPLWRSSWSSNCPPSLGMGRGTGRPLTMAFNATACCGRLTPLRPPPSGRSPLPLCPAKSTSPRGRLPCARARATRWRRLPGRTRCTRCLMARGARPPRSPTSWSPPPRPPTPPRPSPWAAPRSPGGRLTPTTCCPGRMRPGAPPGCSSWPARAARCSRATSLPRAPPPPPLGLQRVW